MMRLLFFAFFLPLAFTCLPALAQTAQNQSAPAQPAETHAVQAETFDAADYAKSISCDHPFHDWQRHIITTLPPKMPSAQKLDGIRQFPASVRDGLCVVYVQKCGEGHAVQPGSDEQKNCDAQHMKPKDDGWVCGVPVDCEPMAFPTGGPNGLPACTAGHLEGCKARWDRWYAFYGNN